ncbi:MAG TPA: tetratricopeptide repeat protein [Myxococcota bacterium]|nr:tetratricopeptide repeat protein [Myxococcota bacterium]
MSDAADDRIAELERAVRADPGGPGFAALAELYRRAGRLADAERVVRNGLARTPRSSEGRAVLLLVLADAGRAADARRQLESWADAALARTAALPMLPPTAEPLAAGVSEIEFEDAFAAAEPDLSQMITPDSIAEEAARQDAASDDRSPLASSGAFATRTMADLLERQGDRRGAARIRAALGESEASPAERNAAAIAALERWLENVRRLHP